MKRWLGLSLMALALLSVDAWAKVEMGAPFSDGMVLQREMKVPVWGKAQPNSTVTVAFAGQNVTATADAEGKWRADLAALTASKESRVMTVTETVSGQAADKVEIKDVLVGEVWFASGQSNMDCPIWGSSPRYRDGNGALVKAMANQPYVRTIKNRLTWSIAPQAIKKGDRVWTPMTAKTLSQGKMLSAVAYYYARELYLALDMPIGIIDSSWGGTNIDAWTPRSGYENCPAELKKTADFQCKKDFDKAKDRLGPINGANQQPCVLWNAMVADYAPMAMRGFIWYQGCHNAGEGDLYRIKMHALYKGWSKEFQNPNLKLYFVQLAPFNQNWVKCVPAQNQFAAEEKNAAIAVISDLGNFHDIHPNRKETVAKRLALHALKRDYGFEIADDDSPTFKAVKFEEGKAIITFDHVKNWYSYALDRKVEPAFEVAGADGKWESAKLLNKYDKNGVITGAELMVASDKVPEPQKVRYMGQPKTSGTLYNEMSLPLGYFESK